MLGCQGVILSHFGGLQDAAGGVHDGAAEREPPAEGAAPPPGHGSRQPGLHHPLWGHGRPPGTPRSGVAAAAPQKEEESGEEESGEEEGFPSALLSCVEMKELIQCRAAR